VTGLGAVEVVVAVVEAAAIAARGVRGQTSGFSLLARNRFFLELLLGVLSLFFPVSFSVPFSFASFPLLVSLVASRLGWYWYCLDFNSARPSLFLFVLVCSWLALGLFLALNYFLVLSRLFPCPLLFHHG
jgi:hypothetical protein